MAGLSLWAMALVHGGIAAANFEVHGTSTPRSEAILRHAEQVRTHVFTTLLGVAVPGAWAVPCAVHLHATEASFEDAVGGPPDGARGAATVEFAGADVCLRRIDLMDDDPDQLPDALAHELVHVVLADYFTAAPPLRWADEGLAALERAWQDAS